MTTPAFNPQPCTASGSGGGVDVEDLILCDTMPDGTVVGTALAVYQYDENGNPVGAPTFVDPATGAPYVPQGTLQSCHAPECAQCETFVMCDTFTTGGTDGETPERLVNGNFANGTPTNPGPTTAPPWVLTPGAAWIGSAGSDTTPGFIDMSGSNQPAGTIEQTVSVTPGLTYRLTAQIGTWVTGAPTQQSIRAVLLDGSDNVINSQTVNPPVQGGGPVWTASVDFTGVATDSTMKVRFIDLNGVPNDFNDILVDSVSLLGPGVPPTNGTTTVVRFRRTVCRNCDGTQVGTPTDTAMDGVTPYQVQGTVGACPDCNDCEQQVLCDEHDVPTTATIPASLKSPLSNGVEYTAPTTNLTGADPAAWNQSAADTTLGWTFGQTIDLRFGVQDTGGGTYPRSSTFPAGTVADSVAPQHTWNAATRVLTFNSAPPAGGSSETILRLPATTSLSSVRSTGNSGTYIIRNIEVTAPVTVRTPFLHTVCRGCDGTVVSVTNTTLDGATTYVVQGEAVDCGTAKDCRNCETEQLCDSGIEQPQVRLTAPTLVSSGTFSNGVTWAATVPVTNQSPTPKQADLGAGNPEGLWWSSTNSFPAVQVGPVTWTWGSAQYTEFSVGLIYNPADTPRNGPPNSVRLPSGVTPVRLPSGYHFDPTTNILSVDASRSADGSTGPNCSVTTNPTVATTARFRTLNPVTSVTLEYTGQRLSTCSRFNNYSYGAFSIGGTSGSSFLRTVCRDCDGNVLAVTNTLLDGRTPYTPSGTVSSCDAPSAQRDMEQQRLCALPPKQRITGGDFLTQVSFDANWPAAQRFGSPAWQFTAGTNTTSGYVNMSPSNTWPGAPGPWFEQTTAVVPGQMYTLSARFGSLSAGGTEQPKGRITIYDGSGAVIYQSTEVLPAIGAANVPTFPAAPNLGPVQVRATDGTMRVRVEDVSNPTAASGAGQQGIDLLVDDVSLIGAPPPVPFLRHYTYTAGKVVSVYDTTVDGITSYAIPAGYTVGNCPDTQAVDCCKPVPVCVQPVTTGTTHFISNEGQLNDGSVEPAWTWAPVPAAGGDPSLAATWYPMYRASFDGQTGGTWSTVDSAATRKAGWIAPHPNARVSNTGASGEGPTIASPSNWWARTQFTLPSNADPASVKVQVTVLNADQKAVQYRWNNGAWVTGGATYQQAAYTTPAQTVPGVVPGQNTLYFQVLEDSNTAPASNGAGVKAHFVVTYDTPAGNAQSWVRMICCDDSSYYLDGNGTRYNALPAGYREVACTPGEDCEYLVLCDTLPAVTPIQATDGAPWTMNGNVTWAPKELTFPAPRFNFNGAPVNGVVTRTMPVEADGTYKITWADSWNGAGSVGGVPGAADAKYTLDIVDAATNAVVQTSGQINVTNGTSSTTAVVTNRELTFTAPASGSVIIRFTDQTDPEPNNRDLLLFPFELANQDPAGVQSPFLRRYCRDSRGLVSFTDTEFDGVTAYEPQGIVGVCATGGSTTEPAGGPVDTGIAQITSGTWTVPANGGGNVQSVTVSVLSGTATVTGSFAGPATVPAGVTMTWSALEDGDFINGLSVTPGSPGNVLVHWTKTP